MMKDFSMHILDIAQNSVRAEAKRVLITVDENITENLFTFEVEDDGKGMSEEMARKIRDPFTTSRTTRKVGLGIPMLEQTCLQCGGSLDIQSELGVGTRIFAQMEYDNIDRPPLGDIISAIHILVVTNIEIDFKYTHRYNGNEYILDVVEVKEVLDDVPLNEPSVIAWLKENIEDGINEIKK